MQPTKPVQKQGGQSWLYRVVNSSFRLCVSLIPLGVMYVAIAAIVGFFGGIGSRVFSFFFNILGA